MTTALVSAAIAALLATPVRAQDPGTIAGTVVAVAPEGRAIMIDVLGPWLGPETTPERREIAIARDARVTLFSRAEVDAAGWAGGYVEERLSPPDLRPGDYATVRLQLRDGRVVADEVRIVRPGEKSRS